MHHNQKGAAHIIVTIVLSVALVGALGYIFYSNFSMQEQPVQTTKKQPEPVGVTQDRNCLVETDDFTLYVPRGFIKTTDRKQQYTASSSFELLRSFVDKDGNYFEIMRAKADGAGYSSDLTWEYEKQENRANIVSQSTQQCESGIGCSSDNDTLEGVISPTPAEKDMNKIYFAFGNNSSAEVSDLNYVGNFVDSFRFK